MSYTTVDSITITPAGATDNCGLYLYEIEVRVSNFYCAAYDPSFGIIPPSAIFVNPNVYFNDDDWLGGAPIFKDTYSTTPQCIWPMEPSAPPVSMQKLLLVGAFPGTTLKVGVIPCTTYPLSQTCLDTTTATTKVPSNPPTGCECEVSINVSPTEVSPQKAGSANTTSTIMVSTTKPAPPEGCTVNFKVEPVENSGGHSHHDDSRRKGTVTPATITIPGGSSGAASAEYKSSEVSGEEKIIAEINGEKKGETTVKVKVPGLQPMPESGQGYWRLTGQTGTHPDNHNGTPATKVRIAVMATDYFESTGIAIGVNDISLMWGGLFDIDGNWSTPHKLHRTGKSVDIDHLGVKEKRLNKIAEKYGCTRYEVDRIHYECP